MGSLPPGRRALGDRALTRPAYKPREALLAAAERLFRVQGYRATGMTELLSESGAPRGSLYFHFPGGKRQIAEEALRRYGRRVESRIRALVKQSRNDADCFIASLVTSFASELADSNWSLGCAAQNLLAELGETDARIAALIASIFEEWIDAIADGLQSRHGARDSVRRDAAAVLSALQGARTLARAMKSTDQFAACLRAFCRGNNASCVEMA